MLKKIEKYLKLVKFSHTIFAMPFAIIGFFLAFESYKPSVWVFIYVVLSMIFARNAAMGFNRYLDSEIDKKNPRTAKREVPAGVISGKNALIFVVINSILFIATTALINTLVLLLSPIALFVVLFYSYTKRFTPLCHFVLGVGLALAPIGAYLAVSSVFAWVPLMFSFTVLLWVSGFDIIYAMQDYEFDSKENLKSIPVLLGKKWSLILSTILHIISAGLVVAVGFMFDFHWAYWIGAGIFVALLFYQHTLVKVNDLSRVNLAFFTTNGVGSLIFGIITVVAILI